LEFEWDDAKRVWVLDRRGIDFLDAAFLFDGRPLLSVATPRNDEDRWLSVGRIEGRMVAVVWTRRFERIRIITMRRARHAEEREYQALFGH
jgi:uncharacterized DUF497 family protein